MIDFIIVFLKWAFFTVSRLLYFYFLPNEMLFGPLLAEVNRSGPISAKKVLPWCFSLV